MPTEDFKLLNVIAVALWAAARSAVCSTTKITARMPTSTQGLLPRKFDDKLSARTKKTRTNMGMSRNPTRPKTPLTWPFPPSLARWLRSAPTIPEAAPIALRQQQQQQHDGVASEAFESPSSNGDRRGRSSSSIVQLSDVERRCVITSGRSPSLRQPALRCGRALTRRVPHGRGRHRAHTR